MITTSADLFLPSSKPHLIISHRDDCVHTSTVYSVSEKKWKHIFLHKMGMATFSIRSFVATRDVIYYLTQRTFVVQQTTSSQLGMVVGMDTHAFGLHQAEHSLSKHHDALGSPLRAVFHLSGPTLNFRTYVFTASASCMHLVSFKNTSRQRCI